MAKAKLTAVARVRALMIRNKWNQTQLCAALGADPAMVSRWLSGQRRPNLDWACKIEQVLGIEVESWRSAA